MERLTSELAAIDKNAMNDRGNIVLLTVGAGTPSNLQSELPCCSLYDWFEFLLAICS